MHCLPANDQRECTREVMDGPSNLIFNEAENRLTAQMALLVYLTHKSIKQPSEETLAYHADNIGTLLNRI